MGGHTAVSPPTASGGSWEKKKASLTQEIVGGK